jgi:hypothetical protein
MFIVENPLPETGDHRAKLRLTKQIYGRVHGQYAPAPAVPIHRSEERQSIASKSKRKFASKKACSALVPGTGDLGFVRWVADGTRTRNNQNHNLELYH